MSIIATVVKAALVVDQRVQAVVHKIAHDRASWYFKTSQDTVDDAAVQTEYAQLQVERNRAAGAALLIRRHKEAMIRLHEDADNKLDLIDGRKQQLLGKASQQRAAAAGWQSTAIKADMAAEAARKAAEQLE